MAEVRLIDAAPLIKDRWVLEKHGVSNCVVGRKSLADVPTIDPESLRPTGRKERSAISGTGLMCTNCYSDVDLDAVFCKYCGAKMEV